MRGTYFTIPTIKQLENICIEPESFINKCGESGEKQMHLKSIVLENAGVPKDEKSKEIGSHIAKIFVSMP